MRRSSAPYGTAGLASYAISAVDIALWDLKARILGVSLCTLLGRAHEGVAIYGSGGFTSYSDDQLEACCETAADDHVVFDDQDVRGIRR